MASGYRYTTVPGSDNRYVVPKKAILTPDYGASIALIPDAEDTTVVVGQLTGDLTLTTDVVAPYTCDKLKVIFTNDSSIRTVTFSTGFIVGTSTLVLQASSQAIIEFTYIDAVSAWVETNRTNYL